MQDRPLNGSVSSTIYLLLVSLFPIVGHTKTAGDSSSSKNTLLRFIMYVENIENLLCINKKYGIPAPFWKKGASEIVSREKYFTKKDNEKLVLIFPPSPNPQLPGPKLWTFPARCPGNILKLTRVLRVVFTPSGRKNESK